MFGPMARCTSQLWLIALLALSSCGEVLKISGDGGIDSAIDAPPVAADITGTVLDVFGTPLSGANVRVGTTMVTTGGDGQFHFALVPATYDLDVVTTDA